MWIQESARLAMRTPRLILPRHRMSAMATMAMTTTSSLNSGSNNSHHTHQQKGFHRLFLGAAVATAATAAAVINPSSTNCEAHSAHSSLTPVEVAQEPFPGTEKSHNGANDNSDTDDDDMDEHPIYTSDQVAENDGSDGKPIWMSYGGVVYDVTDFIANHPGGSEKILEAAGSVRTNQQCYYSLTVVYSLTLFVYSFSGH